MIQPHRTHLLSALSPFMRCLVVTSVAVAAAPLAGCGAVDAADAATLDEGTVGEVAQAAKTKKPPANTLTARRTVVSAAEACPSGSGHVYEFGYDANRSGALEDEEVIPELRSTVCDGVEGARGEPGQPGEPGSPGAEGANGADGAPGPQGPTGAPGAQGIQGNQGAVGPAGPAGPAGSNGADGADGVNGVKGADGADGARGPAGPAGPQGPQGVQGPPGRDAGEPRSVPTPQAAGMIDIPDVGTFPWIALDFGVGNSGAFDPHGTRGAGNASFSDFTVVVDSSYGGAALMNAATLGTEETITITVTDPATGYELPFATLDGVIGASAPTGPANADQHHVVVLSIALTGHVALTHVGTSAKGSSGHETTCSWEVDVNKGSGCFGDLDREAVVILDPRKTGRLRPEDSGFRAEAFSLPVSRSIQSGAGTAGREAARPMFGEASVTTTSFSAESIQIWNKVMTGETIPKVFVGYLTREGAGFPWDVGGPRVDADSTVELQAALVSSYSVGVNANGFTESFSMNFNKVVFESLDDRGGREKFGYDLMAGKAF